MEQEGIPAVATPVPGRRFPDRLLVCGFKSTRISASGCRRLPPGHYDGVAARHPQVAMDEPLVRNFGATFEHHSPRIQHHDDSDKSCPKADEAADDANDEAPEEDERPTERALAASHDAGRRQRSRVRLRGRLAQVAHLVAEDGGRLPQLPDLLGVSKHQHLLVANSRKFEAVLSWRTARQQKNIRAAQDLHRKPWYDFIVYHDAAYPGEAQVGLARLIVRAVDGRRYESIIVQRMQATEPRKGCVLSDFGCRRLKWAMNNTSGFPDLADVKLVDVERPEHVVPDFEDLCERHGLRETPSTMPDTPRERLPQRYFTEIFFPNTSNRFDESPVAVISELCFLFTLFRQQLVFCTLLIAGTEGVQTPLVHYPPKEKCKNCERQQANTMKIMHVYVLPHARRRLCRCRAGITGVRGGRKTTVNYHPPRLLLLSGAAGRGAHSIPRSGSHDCWLHAGIAVAAPAPTPATLQ